MTGNPLVLELLFNSGYTITWENAQARARARASEPSRNARAAGLGARAEQHLGRGRAGALRWGQARPLAPSHAVSKVVC